MSKNTTLLLVIWNVLLSALVAWGLVRKAPETGSAATTANTDDELVTPYVRDTTTIPEGRIAYFYMDSVQQGFELVKEQGDRFRAEGLKLESNLQNEMNKAQKRYQQLMAKDQTYSTKSELQADEQELQALMGKIQEMQSNSEQRLANLEVEMLSKISDEIMEFLKQYNETAGFDYIFSVQNGGQIWVGNPGLDISDAVISGLNQRNRDSKDSPKP
ncbi:MAG: OmpH family outer membrane protein [Flavobacteriales bacterium]